MRSFSFSPSSSLSFFFPCFFFFSLSSSSFFFSSRRRHTRCHGDWSSDVRSSDLNLGFDFNGGIARDFFEVDAQDQMKPALKIQPRSEERRVGKECRSRWSPY